MGDLPEPRYHSMEKDTTSVMTKVTATLGRNFIKSKEFQEAQLMGLETNGNGVTNGIDQAAALKEKQRSIRYLLSYKIIRELPSSTRSTGISGTSLCPSL